MNRKRIIALMTSLVMLFTVLLPASVFASDIDSAADPAPVQEAVDVAGGEADASQEGQAVNDPAAPAEQQPTQIEFVEQEQPAKAAPENEVPVKEEPVQEKPAEDAPAGEPAAPADEPDSAPAPEPEPVVPVVSDEGEHNEGQNGSEPASGGDVSKAFPDDKNSIVAKPGNNDTVKAGEKVEMIAKITSGQSLDSLKFQIKANDCVEITNISTSAFANADGAKFAVYKEFDVTYKDGDKEKSEKYLAPLATGLSSGEEHSVNVDAEFASFDTEYEEPKAEFTGIYYLTFESSLKSSISGEISVKGKVTNTTAAERAGIRISPIYKDKDASASKDWRAKFKYPEPEEPVKEEEPVAQETKEEPEAKDEQPAEVQEPELKPEENIEEPAPEASLRKGNLANTRAVTMADITVGVYDSNGKPIEDVEVEIVAGDGSQQGTAVATDSTGADGKVYLTVAQTFTSFTARVKSAEASYDATADSASRQGQLVQDEDGNYAAEVSLTLPLDSNQQLEGSFEANFSISVVDSDGNPVPNAGVSVVQPYEVDGTAETYTIKEGTTDSNGKFEFSTRLAVTQYSGDFIASVSSADEKYDTSASSATVNGSLENINDVPTGKATLTLPIKKQDDDTGDETFEANFYATVTDTNEDPVEGVKLSVGLKASENNYEVIGTMTTDEDGLACYTEEAATAGEYIIKVDESGWEGSDGYDTANAYAVGNISEDNPDMDADITLKTKEQAVNSCVIVVKTISLEDESGIKGAKYTVTLTGTDNAYQLETGEDGTAKVENLEPGEYIIEETSIPEEFDALCDPVTINLVEGTFEYSFKHNKKTVEQTTCKLIIKAEDKDDETGIEGAKYTVTKAGSEDAVELTTMADGTISTEGLEFGDYVVKETFVPEEYDGVIEDAEPVTLNKSSYTLTFQHAKKTAQQTAGKITIKAVLVGEDEEVGIEGAKYTVTNVGTEESVELVTEEDGTISIGDLEPGDYVVKETEVPEEYDGVIEETKTISVENGTYKVTFQHNKKGEEPTTTAHIVIKSICDSDETGIVGAKYTITKVGSEESIELTTGEDGTITSDELEPGDYEVKEISVPEEYDGVVENAQPVDLTKGSCTVNFHHNKKSQEQTACRLIVKAELEDGTAIEGAKYKVTKADSEDGAIELTTGADGTATTEVLEPGNYVVKETFVPEGYDGVIEDAANAPLTQGDFTLRFKHSRNVEEEDPKDAKLNITVINSETEDPVAGAIVTVTSGDEVIYEDLSTSEDGLVVAEELPAGTYTVAIADPGAGYETDEGSEVDVTIDASATKDVELTVTPLPIEEEGLAVTSFTGLQFNPDEVEAVVGNPFEMNLDGYDLQLNKEGSTASQVVFRIEGFTPDMNLFMDFDGTATGYLLQAIVTSSGNTGASTKTIAMSGSSSPDADRLAVKYDSLTAQEESSTPEVSLFPENAKLIKIYVYNPSEDFAVTDFRIYGATPDIEHDPDAVTLAGTTAAAFVVRSEVTIEGTETDTTDESKGTLVLVEPEAELTMTPSVAENETAYVNSVVSYTADFVNTSGTQYLYGYVDLVVPDFQATTLNVGTIENYEGRILVQTVSEDGEVALINQVSQETTVDVSDKPSECYRIVLLDPLTGEEEISGIQIKGRYAEEGTMEAIAQFTGVLTEYPEDSGLVSKSWVIGEPATIEVIEKQEEIKNGEIEVTVVDENDDPIGDVEFTIYAETSSSAAHDIEHDIPTESGSYKFYGVKVGNPGKTDEDGVFSTEIPEGTYMIMITSVPEEYEMPEANCERFVLRASDPYVRNISLVTKDDSGDDNPDDPGDDNPDDPGDDNPGGGGSGYNPPSPGGDDEPVDEPVELAVDTPNIYANSNTIAYGDDAIFNIRNLNAVGMETDNYYVLHIMIPEGVQVRSLSFPGFGGSVKVSLAYQSGSTELGTYVSNDSVALTERQGSNMRYISFQMRNMTEVKPDGDVTIMLKNISARDRVATLQAILSVRDAKTAVREQHYDKYNIALAGPKTSPTSGTSTNGTTSADLGSTTTSDIDTAGVAAARVSNESRPYPMLLSVDGLVSDILIEPKPDYVTIQNNIFNTKPLLLPEDPEMKPAVKETGAENPINVSPVTNDTIRAFVHMMNKKHLLRENFGLQKSPALMTRILRANKR